ncbi:DUF6538 domain-containing protein [Paracoccus cavernae]|uniref:DUF6538 domain-containing protein n=1 Tax=Paracoccus cavernae TaxID=1571207 RepID=UPI0035F3718C
MAGAQRYLLNRDGRFFARLVVPKDLRAIIGKSELRTPLGPDRRAAIKMLPTAVAAMQAEIAVAGRRVRPDQTTPRTPVSTEDFGRAVWERYSAALEADTLHREQMSNPSRVEAASASLVRKVQALGSLPVDPIAVLNLSLEYLAAKETRFVDRRARAARLRYHSREGTGRCREKVGAAAVRFCRCPCR